jgi:hypothetical protein
VLPSLPASESVNVVVLVPANDWDSEATVLHRATAVFASFTSAIAFYFVFLSTVSCPFYSGVEISDCVGGRSHNCRIADWRLKQQWGLKEASCHVNM